MKERQSESFCTAVGFFMIEGMVSCALCLLVTLLSVHYFSQSVVLYQKACKRLRAIEYLQYAYEKAWIAQRPLFAQKSDGYTCAYHTFNRPESIEYPSQLKKTQTFHYGYIALTTQETDIPVLQIPFGYISKERV